MDTAVAWVQAYLQTNGYFTLAEYQVIEALTEGGYRTATDLDIMAVRFPGAGRLVPKPGRPDQLMAATDPRLDVSEDEIDLIIGEVKEGVADINQAARNPDVLNAALSRFGAVDLAEAKRIVEKLIETGQARSDLGFRVRLAAFGTKAPLGPRPFFVMDLGHISRYLQDLCREHWATLSAAHFSDPVFGSLMLMEKARRAGETD